jgi:nucleotide-binding universal stress UspA family protein
VKPTAQKVSPDPAVPGSGAFRSVIAPLDLSPGSDRILGRLALLSLADDARVTLLHVVPGSLRPRERHGAERDAKKALADEARHLRTQLGKEVRIEAVVKVGAAAKEIAACAAHGKAELIVMGRAGRSPLRDAFLGSTAERVIRQARIPVLVVRLAARSAYRRPALALDLDQAAHEVVRFMLLVLSPPRPRVEIIHAIDAPYQGLVYRSLTEDEAEERKEELRSNATRELAKLLATALAKANVGAEEGRFCKTHVLHGSPRIVVEKVVKKSEADLLVLGTRGHSGVAYVLLGTVAGDLLRAARCDVLMVPPSHSK